MLQLNTADSGLLITSCQGYFMDYWVCLSFNDVSNYDWKLKLFIEDKWGILRMWVICKKKAMGSFIPASQTRF